MIFCRGSDSTRRAISISETKSSLVMTHTNIIYLKVYEQKNVCFYKDYTRQISFEKEFLF